MSSNLDAEIAHRIAAKSKCAPPLPPTKEELRERLAAIFLLVKAAREEEDGAAADALGDEASAAENALVALEVEGDDIYMPAAKLIIAKAGEIFEDINDSIRDTRLNAEAALSALRLFGLVELYRQCFDDGFDAVDEEGDASDRARASDDPMAALVAKREPDRWEDLPFVSRKDRGPRNFWNVTSTGDYGKDCELGHEYAKLALLEMLLSNSGAVLGWIVLDMIADFQPLPKEEWEKSSIANAKGIIVGFMREIAAHAERSKNIDQILLHHDAVQVTKTTVFPCRERKLVWRED